MMCFRFIAFFLTLSAFYGCLPPDEPNDSIDLNLQYSEHRQIVKWQNSRLTDSLLLMLSHSEASVRYNACIALASVQDSSAIGYLSELLLNDPVNEVKHAAAYALGQTYNASAAPLLQHAFKSKADENFNPETNGLILEALGKTADLSTLNLIATAKPYNENEVSLWRGKALALMRFLNRNIRSTKAVEAAISILFNQQLPDEARLIAAVYLSRLDKIREAAQIEYNLPVLLNAEQNSYIRAFAALSIKHMNFDSVPDWLMAKYQAEELASVRINLVRSTILKPAEQFMSFWMQAVSDSNKHVGSVASEIILQNMSGEFLDTIWSITTTDIHWLTRANLAAASLKVATGIQKNAINENIKEWYNHTLNLYEKSALIKALSFNRENLNFISEPALSTQTSVIRSSAAEAVLNITREIPVSSLPRNQGEMAVILETLDKIFELNDPAILSSIATNINQNHPHLLRLDALEKKLVSARSTLSLPSEVQTYNDLTRVIYNLQDLTDFKPLEIKDSRPIDWHEITRLSQFDLADIYTNKGTITIKMNWINAPLTCASFLKMAEKSYYDNKVFHRVVPNFVIQGGCSRGDGWGSEDFTLRSELGPEYYHQSGMVGMASAGKDTESVQFFITHMPAPHLDGRYTIFANVIQGMEVVNSIQIGDRINKIEGRISKAEL